MNRVVSVDSFHDNLIALQRIGREDAYKDTRNLITDMALGLPPEAPEFHNKYSKRGESRIKHCKKFRPTEDTRLVTVFEQGTWVLCYVGLKNDAEKWCEKYSDHCIEHQNGKWYLVPESRSRKDRKYKAEKTQPHIVTASNALLQPVNTTPVINKLPAKSKEAFLKKFCKNDKEIVKIVKGYTGGNVPDLPGMDDENQTHIYEIYEILFELRESGEKHLDNAIVIINGGTKPLDGTTRSDIKESSTQIQIINDVDEWLATINKAATNDDWKTWMTRMHPDQQKIVDKDYPGPVYLKGVSGSGKTAIIVNRAERLAKKYPEEKVLIVTLNRSLAKLIQKLISTKCPELKNIEVDAFFNICRNRLKELGHDLRLFDDKSDVHGIHVDEIWDRYYLCEENNRDAASFFEFHDLLISEGHSINPKSYIRDELDWIRSAFQPSNRDAYENAARKDRKKPLDPKKREPILKGLNGWEEKLAFVGVTDYLNLSSQLSDPGNLDLLSPIYRSILVDEAQDFGTTELTIIRRLAADNENDLFFSGDSAQKISHKYQDFSAAKINIKHNPMPDAEKNYRNTREIIVYANNVLEKYNKAHQLNIDIIKPEATDRSGLQPMLLKSDNHASELANAIAYLKHISESNSKSKYCIAVCGHTEYELCSYAKEIGLPVLDGSTTLDDGTIFISDLENTKGFEFDTVIVTNCSDTFFPPRYSSDDDKAKNISRLYVAMTRAKHELIISFSGRPSDYVSNIEQIELAPRSIPLTNFMASHRVNMQDFADPNKIENIKKFKNFSDEIYKEAIAQNSSKAHIKWDDFLAESKVIEISDIVGDVKSLEQLKQDRKRIGEMNFEQFLFTEYAIGLPKDLVRILRKTSNAKLSILYDEINSSKFREESGLKAKPELYRKLYDRIEHIKSLNLY